MDFDKIVNRKNTSCAKYDDLEAVFGKKDLMPLWIADMDFEVCPEISATVEKRAAHKIYGYPSTPESYWESIINWNKHRHNFSVTREELSFMPGIVRAIGYVVNYFTEKGDKILIQPPVYHPFKNIILGNQRTLVENPLKCTPTTMEMDLEGFRKTVETEKPKMMILCNPHNPGGVVWSKETLTEVAHICYENHVLVVSDEIHGDVELFGNHYTPFLTLSDESRAIGISLGAPSKTFNIPGLVSSWCVVKNPELRKGFFAWLSANEFNEPTMFVPAATEAAYNRSEPWLDEVLKYIEKNILFVEDYIKEHIPAIKVHRPQASYLLWLDCSALGLNNADLNSLFIDKAGLALNNGAMFGEQGAQCMRLNVGCPRSVLKEALVKLENAINEK